VIHFTVPMEPPLVTSSVFSLVLLLKRLTGDIVLSLVVAVKVRSNLNVNLGEES